MDEIALVYKMMELKTKIYARCMGLNKQRAYKRYKKQYHNRSRKRL